MFRKRRKKDDQAVRQDLDQAADDQDEEGDQEPVVKASFSKRFQNKRHKKQSEKLDE